MSQHSTSIPKLTEIPKTEHTTVLIGDDLAAVARQLAEMAKASAGTPLAGFLALAALELHAQARQNVETVVQL